MSVQKVQAVRVKQQAAATARAALAEIADELAEAQRTLPLLRASAVSALSASAVSASEAARHVAAFQVAKQRLATAEAAYATRKDALERAEAEVKRLTQELLG